LAAAQGLHGLQGLAAAQGLHGLQGLQAAAAQGLHGLHGLQAAICTEVSAVLADALGSAMAEVARVATLRAMTVSFSMDVVLPNKVAGRAGGMPVSRDGPQVIRQAVGCTGLIELV
jgi:hypothetical protein